MPSTLFDKVWDSHVVSHIDEGPDVFFIDRHFIHEVTSPVAFLGLETRGLKVMFPEKTFATADHNTRYTPPRLRSGCIAIKIINDLGDDVVRMFGA